MFWILLLLWMFDIITFRKAIGIWILWILSFAVLYFVTGTVVYSFFAGLFSCIGV